jgi:hypothetical protein
VLIGIEQVGYKIPRVRLGPDNTFQLSDHTVCCVPIAPKYLDDPCDALPSDAVESLQPRPQTESSNTSQPSSSAIAWSSLPTAHKCARQADRLMLCRFKPSNHVRNPIHCSKPLPQR